MQISKAYMKSPVGLLKINATRDYVTKIIFCEEMTDEDNSPENDLISDCIQQLENYFAGKSADFSFAISQNGTPFQQKVWNELMHIAPGNTTSYLNLSKSVGDVKAIRAVGTANGKNDIAIVVPCHRVIGSDGSLTGYAGGLWRKQWLLGHEAKFWGKAHQQQLF